MSFCLQVGVTINNSSFNITRIVTFTPFFMISNRSKYTLEVAEEGKEKWIPIVLQQVNLQKKIFQVVSMSKKRICLNTQ